MMRDELYEIVKDLFDTPGLERIGIRWKEAGVDIAENFGRKSFPRDRDFFLPHIGPNSDTFEVRIHGRIPDEICARSLIEAINQARASKNFGSLKYQICDAPLSYISRDYNVEVNLSGVNP